MPYINREQRRVIDPAIGELVEAIKQATVYRGTAFRDMLPDGALNYAITKLILKLIIPTTNYLNIERVRGLLGCLSDEFYRKLAAAYEDLKAQENGEVFDP